jgi:hypothetical protein
MARNIKTNVFDFIAAYLRVQGVGGFGFRRHAHGAGRKPRIAAYTGTVA